MLKRKLEENGTARIKINELTKIPTVNSGSDNTVILSEYFNTPLWKKFFDLELILNANLEFLKAPNNITHIYNPLEYAAELHVQYLRKFLDGPKKMLIVGMNPGPNGMGQTGIPFGNISTVRTLMEISGRVYSPKIIHPKRPVNGLLCNVEEPSGVRLWNLLYNLAGQSFQTFSRQCFVHNFCPLAFFDKDGKNITPSELKGQYKAQIRDTCLATFEQLLALVEPTIIVAVGEYVHTTFKKSIYCSANKLLKLPHPSPRSLNNHNWPEKAESFFKDHDLIKFLRNEI